MPSFKVKAVYKYESPHEDDLSFPEGQIITVTEVEDEDWYVGEYVDEAGNRQDGLFPQNFVEKYEPELPARPNRASRHKPLDQQPVQQAPPTPDLPQQESAPAPPVQEDAPKQPPPPVEIPQVSSSQVTSPTSPASAPSGATKSSEIPLEPPTASKPSVPESTAATTAPPAKKAPPPVAAKNSAFLNRIAAFNQPAASPIQPFKPGGQPSTFVKKPFVAPPPSRNAYVPPPREAPQVKSYRRDEDPEVAERQAQDQENAERAGFAGNPTSNDGEGEDPAPTVSLKERIARLQKEQQEQATRAAALQKEKPKRPPVKKRTESHEAPGDDGEGGLDRSITGESRERTSTDHTRPPRSAHGVQSPDQTNRELMSDANDADQSGAGETEDADGASTSVEEEEERARQKHAVRAPAAPAREPDVGDEQDVEEEEEEEEDEEAAEARRKMELRERMARIGGGFGMPGMFGGGMPMGVPPPKKKKPEKKSTADSEEYSMPQQRVPMFGLPGVKSPEIEDRKLAVEKEDEESHSITLSRPANEVPDVEDVARQPMQRTPTAERSPPLAPEKRPVPPPISAADRPVPPPVPSASRPVPSAPVRSPSPGSESGDEMTDAQMPESATSPKTPSAIPPLKNRDSYLASDEMSGDSPDKRAMPPIPLASPTLSPVNNRPPPPPPPFAAPPRTTTADRLSKKIDREGETDYEGDYDTDIASGATHKDALKSHIRDSSMEDSTTADEASVRSPITPAGPPPLPPSVPRAVPPPPPQQPPSRVSLDAPRSAPPLPPVPPPTRDIQDDDDEYDPYRYTGTPRAVPPAPKAMPPPPQSHPPPPQNRPPPPAMPPMPPSIPPTPQMQSGDTSEDEDDLYTAPPPRKSHDRPPPPPPQAPPPQDRPAPPPPPPQERTAPPPPREPAPQPRTPAARKSLDVNRAVQGRVSMDQPRPSVSQDFIATDVDLGASTHWWTQPNMVPPSLQGRKDVLVDLSETRSGNTVDKLVQVLYMDYSQSIISARFEANNVSNVELEQTQEPPPARLRQDQLEDAHQQLGSRIAKDVESKQNTVVGDGTPQGLILQLLSPYKDALRPVSTRSFGAIVYANLANASTQQYDEIRPGDIISFRNAKFQGKHGAMHAKYSVEVGKPDHVGIVQEWDGSKKKVRVWGQWKESKKVKPESFRMEDLRSGEVRVWRVMSRHWVGWH